MSGPSPFDPQPSGPLPYGRRPERPHGFGAPPGNDVGSPFVPPPASPSSPWAPLAFVCFVVLIAALVGLWLSDPDRWRVGSGLVAIPLLVVVTIPLATRARRATSGFDIGALMIVALLLRLLAAFYRYDHRFDAGLYHVYGSQLAESFRSLQFDVDVGAPIPGTGGQRYITGVVEVLTNSNEFATFLAFAWLGFIGCYLFYQAFRTALPNGDHRRYALLIFLWPTLVFWPSSISKDGWMVFTIGLASLGIARVLTRARGGYVLFALGALLASVVRPHVAMIAVVAFGIALLFARRPSAQAAGRATPSSIAKVAGFIAVLVIGALLASQLGDFLDARDLTVDSAIETNLEKTAQGASAFAAADPQNPLGYARASFNILFRPLPFEADGVEQVLTSFEAIFLAGLCVVSWRRLVSVPFRLRRDPYVAYAVATILMFIFVLGTIGNFGILARQRTQIVPFVFVLLCVSVPARVGRDTPAVAEPPHR